MRRFVSGMVACLLAAGVVVIGIAKTAHHAFSQGVAPYKWDANWQPEWLTILPIAKEAAAPILRGEAGNPSYLLQLRQAHQALPVSVPRPITCLAFMDAAVSKSRSTVPAVRTEARESAQRSIECYEGRRVDGTVATSNRELICPSNAVGPRAQLPNFSGLWIGGRWFTRPNDPGLVQFLKQDDPQKRVRIATLCAMMWNQHRRFVFRSESDLRWNIALRERFIEEMSNAISGSASGCHFAGDPGQFALRGWERYKDPRGAHYYESWPDGKPDRGAWRSMPGISAHDAIQPLRSRQTGLDCLLGVQIIVLETVDAVLSEQRPSSATGAQFNALHPVSGSTRALFGLGIPLNMLVDNSSFLGPRFAIHITLPSVNSVALHLIVVRVHIRPDRKNPPVAGLDQLAGPLAGPISVADMVPGDHVYIENRVDYGMHHPKGAWNGENAVYMDKGLFGGLGVGHGHLVTEEELRNELAQAYNYPDERPGLGKDEAKPNEMQWTLIAAPSLFGSKDEAGYFTNP